MGVFYSVWGNVDVEPAYWVGRRKEEDEETKLGCLLG